jgi:DNA-binding transcriptional LysR family regulator
MFGQFHDCVLTCEDGAQGSSTRAEFQEALDTATMVSLVSCRLGAAFVNVSYALAMSQKNVVLLSISDLNLSIPSALVWRKDTMFLHCLQTLSRLFDRYLKSKRSPRI